MSLILTAWFGVTLNYILLCRRPAGTLHRPSKSFLFVIRKPLSSAVTSSPHTELRSFTLSAGWVNAMNRPLPQLFVSSSRPHEQCWVKSSSQHGGFLLTGEPSWREWVDFICLLSFSNVLIFLANINRTIRESEHSFIIAYHWVTEIYHQHIHFKTKYPVVCLYFTSRCL